MNESEISTTESTPSPAGFQISERPVVRKARREPGNGKTSADLPASYGVDLLYLVARDPATLFLYWDVNWTRLFAQAGLSPRQVHLRIYREDGSVEDTREINPFRGHCYVHVAAGGTIYYCELGCFEHEEWRSLARSGTTATPEAAISDDLSAEFATLPIHLSFQRLLDIFRATAAECNTLALSVAELQENARLLHEGMEPGDWPQVVAATTEALGGGNGNGRKTDPAEIAALLEGARQSARRVLPTAEQLARWQALSQSLGGSSPGGASEPTLGGSSLA